MRLKAPECAYLSPVKKSVKGFEIQLLGKLVAAEAWQLPNLQLSTKIAVFLFQIWVFPAGILEDKEPLSGHFDGSVLNVLGRNLFLLFVFRLCSTWTAVVCKEKKYFEVILANQRFHYNEPQKKHFTDLLFFLKRFTAYKRNRKALFSTRVASKTLIHIAAHKTSSNPPYTVLSSNQERWASQSDDTPDDVRWLDWTHQKGS